MNNLLDHLKKRGLIDAISSPDLEKRLEKPIKVYVGFDPTADSLHLGNLIGILALAHFQKAGHTPVVVLGGTTARIGDPSGKSQERPLLDRETILENVSAIRLHFEQILDFSGRLPAPEILNNDTWFENMGLVDFLRDVGKHARISTMLAKDTVRSRLDSGEGMSFTEFTYQLIQASDFCHLRTEEGVLLQMGGSDQWGNITAGIELTRKMSGKEVFGLTWPLLTRSDGKKFGKSEKGAIWLAEKRCSPYQFYQYLFGIPDQDVIAMLKRLTFMDLEEIDRLQEEMRSPNYEPNRAQRRLAEEVTRIIHGEEGLEKAQRATSLAAPGKEAQLNAEALLEMAQDLPSVTLPREQVLGKGYADLAVASGLLESKGEGNRLLKNGGGYLNNEKVVDFKAQIQEKDLINGKFLLVGAGKKKKAIIQIL